jgi:calcium-dependent protein kinase
MIAQIVSAVEHIHNLSIAHRDLSLSNLLLTNDAEPRIKLTDFGYACDTRKETYGKSKDIHDILSQYEFSNDIWSIGAIMHLLLSGRSPMDYRDSSVSNLSNYNEFEGKEWDGISNEAKDLLKGMLETEWYPRWKIDKIKNSRWIKVFIFFYLI